MQVLFDGPVALAAACLSGRFVTELGRLLSVPRAAGSHQVWSHPNDQRVGLGIATVCFVDVESASAATKALTNAVLHAEPMSITADPSGKQPLPPPPLPRWDQPGPRASTTLCPTESLLCGPAGDIAREAYKALLAAIDTDFAPDKRQQGSLKGGALCWLGARRPLALISLSLWVRPAGATSGGNVYCISTERASRVADPSEEMNHSASNMEIDGPRPPGARTHQEALRPGTSRGGPDKPRVSVHVGEESIHGGAGTPSVSPHRPRPASSAPTPQVRCAATLLCPRVAAEQPCPAGSSELTPCGGRRNCFPGLAKVQPRPGLFCRAVSHCRRGRR